DLAGDVVPANTPELGVRPQRLAAAVLRLERGVVLDLRGRRQRDDAGRDDAGILAAERRAVGTEGRRPQEADAVGTDADVTGEIRCHEWCPFTLSRTPAS